VDPRFLQIFGHRSGPTGRMARQGLAGFRTPPGGGGHGRRISNCNSEPGAKARLSTGPVPPSALNPSVSPLDGLSILNVAFLDGLAGHDVVFEDLGQKPRIVGQLPIVGVLERAVGRSEIRKGGVFVAQGLVEPPSPRAHQRGCNGSRVPTRSTVLVPECPSHRIRRAALAGLPRRKLNSWVVASIDESRAALYLHGMKIRLDFFARPPSVT